MMGGTMTLQDVVSQWTVVLVDDEPDNIGVVEKLLTFYGAKVHVATNGVEGLKVLETVTPTFILLDLSMPIMDGWEMFEQLKVNVATAPLPVFALTAHAMPEDIERVKNVGFDAYIPKPIRIATFMLEIQTGIERHAAKVKAATTQDAQAQDTATQDAVVQVEPTQEVAPQAEPTQEIAAQDVSAEDRPPTEEKKAEQTA
jgi:two-component system, cell cycle response regulator DivK